MQYVCKSGPKSCMQLSPVIYIGKTPMHVFTNRNKDLVDFVQALQHKYTDLSNPKGEDRQQVLLNAVDKRYCKIFY